MQNLCTEKKRREITTIYWETKEFLICMRATLENIAMYMLIISFPIYKTDKDAFGKSNVCL